MRAVVLTSDFLRHRYVVNRAAQTLDVVGVWQEQKAFKPLSYAVTDDDERVIAGHFSARDRSEAEFFGSYEHVKVAPGTVIRLVDPGGINDEAELVQMVALRPDVVLVFGTQILRAPLIAAFEGRIINLHLGLSPYYRGAGTNFWPLVNREPEYVGATIHYLDAGIDTGPILAHVRPEMRKDDGPHDIGNRTIVAAADVLIDAAVRFARGRLEGIPQTRGGRLYLRKHFNADAVRALYANFADGMIDQYLNSKAARDRALSLVSLEVAAS